MVGGKDEQVGGFVECAFPIAPSKFGKAIKNLKKGKRGIYNFIKNRRY